MNFLIFQNIIYEYIFSKLLKKWIRKDFIPNNYKYFVNSSEIGDWGNFGNLYFKKLNNLKNNVIATKEELFELKSFDFYQGYVGERMNNLLRGTNSYLDNDSLFEYITSIENTLNKFELKENIVVLRRTDAKLFNNYKTNSNFNEFGFLSTSINLSHREDSEGNNRQLRNEALLILKIPSKSNALYVEEVQNECRRRNEYELLIQKGSRIKIENNFKIFSNRIIIGTLFQN
jgi:hypothetical protein